MNFKLKFYRKLLSLITFVSILFQSFAPYLVAATPIHAQENIAVEEITPVPTEEPNPTIVEEPIPTIAEESTPTAEITPTPTIIENPELTIESDEPKTVDPSATLVMTPTPAEIDSVIEQECFSQDQELINSTNEDWNIDPEKNLAETKEKVKVGVKYVFPQENNVTITFRCLPKDESLRTSLKVEQIKVSDLELPEDVNPYGEYAYDITTGMADGTFEYDITLPKPKNQEAKVFYMEDVNSEVKNINDDKINQEGDKITAENLNHFTIFIVVSPNETADDNSVNNEDNTWTSDNQYARFNSSSDSAEYGFPNLNIPADSIIEGIEVFVEGYRSGGNRNLNIAIWNKSNSSPDTFTNSKLATLTGTDTIHTLGDPTEKWGKTWIPSDFDSSFRVKVQATTGGGDAYLDHIQVKVYYTEPGPLFTPPTLSYNDADDYALTSVSGIWTATSGGSNIIGLNTEEVKWGTSSGYGQSGLRFDGSSLQSFNEGNSFYLGALTHFNWPIYNAADGATLKITLQFLRPGISPNPQFTFDFDIEETPNTSGSCPSWQQSSTPCDDKITFPSSYGQESFTIGDKLYTLKILGFVDSYPSGSPMSEFITEEHKNNTAFLVGTLSSVLVEAPQLTLVEKAVNGQDADSAPGPELAVGSLVNWTYNIQNTGNVPLTNISVIDDKGITVTCPKTTLDPGENMICNASGTAVTGQYTNSAYAQGKHEDALITSNNEVANYFGVVQTGAIKITKDVVPDDSSTWNFTITGTGGPYNITGLGDGASQTINDLQPGSYNITETTNSAYSTSVVCGGVQGPAGNAFLGTVVAGQTLECAFTNTKEGSINVNKYVDKNANGIKDGTDSNYTFTDVTMYLYSGSNCQGNHLTFANVHSGYVLFNNIVPGQYSVKEAFLPNNWKNSTPLCQNITVVPGEQANLAFGNVRLGQINISKFNDLNGNGLKESGELGLQGWTINLVGPNGYSESKTTDGAGNVGFSNLEYGSYTYSEVMQGGWYETVPSGGRTYTFNIDYANSGSAINTRITNFKYGAISGQKFNDLNADGIKDAGEDGLPGWTIELDKNADGSFEDSTITDADGNYSFSDLVYGTYRVREASQSGWIQTTANPIDILVQSGTNVTDADFGNARAGKITVCKVVVDPEGNVTNGATVSGTDFNINWNGSDVNFGPTVFTTTINLNSDIFGDEANDAQCITYSNLPLGNYYYSEEVISKPNVWEEPLYNDQYNTNIDDLDDLFDWSGPYTNPDRNYDSDGHIVLSASRPERTLVVKNQYEPTIIKAHKIVCDSETDLPNWGDSASGVVNATSAENFVNSSNGKCRFVSDWDFEWGFDGEAPKPQPDFYGYSGAPWSSFDSKTTSSDPAILTINNLEGNTKIWFKEVLQSNYIPFTYYSGSGVGSNISAEFYCHDDHYKYDNYEAINNPQYGQTYYCVAFNAPSTGIVQIHKFNDPNFNGQIDGNEAGIENWEFTLYNGSDCVSGSEVAGSTGLTDNIGDIDFENLPAGDYSVKETPQTGWDNSTNICQNVSVLAGQTSSLNFGNYELGKIIIDKETTPENDLTEFQFTIDAQDSTFGDKIFMLADQSLPEETWLKPGAYTVSETPDSNWNSRVECYTDEMNIEEDGQLDVRGFQLIPEVSAQNSIRVPVDPNAINLDPGETITCTFYNDYITPELTIQKFNNLWPVDQTAGAVINFTITVKASKNNVRGVRVIDLMPDGFTFNGTWTVMKNGTDITAQVPNPNYASPGEWDLGDMEKDDEIVITFPATISEDQDPGLYKDLAYAYGCQASYLSNTNGLLAARRIDNNLDTCEITDEEVILASSQDSGKTDDGVITEEFVGTQVNLVKDLQNSKSYEVEKEEEKIGEVLGASTMLPGTGADSLMTKLLWLFLAGSLLSLFFLLKRNSLKSLLIMLIALSISASSAMAATTPLTVRMEQPKSPTNDNTFNITYTTMDLQNREITAKCFKKGPTDAAYSQFGSTVNYIGGGSGNCVVNSSVMNNSGTYLFKVEVLAGLDSNSDSVTVDFGSSSLPETPVEYDKRKIEDCKYRIKGKSADDGKTVKVELYRSDDLEFKADGGSRVHTFNVGPNTSFELDNSVPHCDRDYYYALRAFDAYGNGSDLIGDRNIKVTFTESTTTETTTSETGALLVEGGANIAQEVVATEETTESEEAQIETEKTEESEKAEETGEGEVLGVKAAKTAWDRVLTFAKENPLTTVIIIGGLGILLYASVKAYKSGKKS